MGSPLLPENLVHRDAIWVGGTGAVLGTRLRNGSTDKAFGGSGLHRHPSITVSWCHRVLGGLVVGLDASHSQQQWGQLEVLTPVENNFPECRQSNSETFLCGEKCFLKLCDSGKCWTADWGSMGWKGGKGKEKKEKNVALQKRGGRKSHCK